MPRDVPAIIRQRAQALRVAALERVERRLGPHVDQLPHSPVFILGPPRCGSTLLFQMLATRFDMGYFANQHCDWRGAPYLVERRHPTARRAPPALDSTYGRTEGRYGPSECGPYWYRFFPRAPHSVATIADVDQTRLRHSLGALVSAAGRPFLIKNLFCAGRLPTLSRTFPEALFIVIRRDPVDTGHSILAARHDVLGRYDQWWSFRPEGVEDVEHEAPEVQVAAQIRLTYDMIEKERARIGDGRFLNVSYEALCAEPAPQLDQVATWLGRHGQEVHVIADVPSSLPRRHGLRIESDLYGRLVQEVGKHG